MMLNRLQRLAVISRLTDSLRENGSWGGETHVQKGAYFLQEMMDVPTGYDFILYKHGPFSFDLRDELTEMRADGLIELVPQQYPYGPKLSLTDHGKNLQNKFDKTLKKHGPAIESVAVTLGGKDVSELERLSTALFVSKELGSDASPEERAERLRELKPHVSDAMSLSAVKVVDELLVETAG